MTFNQFYTELKKQIIHPVYFFYGDEEFIKEDAISRIVNILLTPESRPFDFSTFYADDIEIEKIITTVDTPPALSKKRVVIVRNLHKLPAAQRTILLDYIEQSYSTTCLILVVPQVDKNRYNLKDKFYSTLIKNTTAVEFRHLSTNQLYRWIIQQFEMQRKKVSVDAVRVLIETVGNSLIALSNEINKICLYSYAKEKIEIEDIRTVTCGWQRKSIFELTEAIADKNVTLSLELLNELLYTGEQDKIIGAIYWYLMLLAKLKVYHDTGLSKPELSRQLGIPGYFMDKYLAQSSNFSLSEFERFFELLFQADLDIKSTTRDPKIILELLIYQLCS